ncbi:MAG: hypothetical protein U0893_02340 [Chloroflexota bacterium]
MTEGQGGPSRRTFVPAPPLPPAYGPAAMVALALGVFGGFAVGLYALGGPAFGWPAQRYAALTQAHGQIQTLGLIGLLVMGVGGLLLPGFWKTKLDRPRALSAGAGLVGTGLAAQLVGQPLDPGPIRELLLVVGALLPPAGFGWAGLTLVRLRLRQPDRPAVWEAMLTCAGLSLAAALLLRAASLLDLAVTGVPASFGVAHPLTILLELEGFIFGATVAVQLRLLPSLARTRPVTGWPAAAGLVAYAGGLLARVAGTALVVLWLSDLGSWLELAAAILFFWGLGLGRAGLGRTVEAPATLLPPRTRVVLRAAWAGLLLAVAGRATGLAPADTATHAFTSVYLMPLVLVVGIRMLPRVSAYPVRFPRLSGALVWAGLLGGAVRAFGELLGGQLGWQASWIGGLLLFGCVVVFAALCWSPWGVPTGQPRPLEVALYRAGGFRVSSPSRQPGRRRPPG